MSTYARISIDLLCNLEVPEARAKQLAANMRTAMSVAARSWIAVQDRTPGVKFLVGGEEVPCPALVVAKYA